jgi:hypothetical protein
VNDHEFSAILNGFLVCLEIASFRDQGCTTSDVAARLFANRPRLTNDNGEARDASTLETYRGRVRPVFEALERLSLVRPLKGQGNRRPAAATPRLHEMIAEVIRLERALWDKHPKLGGLQ